MLPWVKRDHNPLNLQPGVLCSLLVPGLHCPICPVLPPLSSVCSAGVLTTRCFPESQGEGRDPRPRSGERPGARALGKCRRFRTGRAFLSLVRETGRASRLGNVEMEFVVDFHKGLKFLSAVLPICYAAQSKPRSLSVIPQTSVEACCVPGRPWNREVVPGECHSGSLSTD